MRPSSYLYLKFSTIVCHSHVGTARSDARNAISENKFQDGTLRVISATCWTRSPHKSESLDNILHHYECF